MENNIKNSEWWEEILRLSRDLGDQRMKHNGKFISF